MSGAPISGPIAALQKAWAQAGSTFPASPVGAGVHPCPGACLVVKFEEILGLYKPGIDARDDKPRGTTCNASWVPNYFSEDDKGRIYINRLPNLPKKQEQVWKKRTQYIELTVTIEPPSVPIPPGTKVTWSFEDPDDPSNEDPRMHRDAGMIIDPEDYVGRLKVAADPDDNDPSKLARTKPKFLEAAPRYALSGNETEIHVTTRTSKVRFQFSDIAGDNYKIKAEIKPVAPITSTVPASTGVMTVWNKIQVEYVKMKTATELPVDQIAVHFDVAFAQVDIAEKREVDDKSPMGNNDISAEKATQDFASKDGAFKHEGEGGWFFIGAAKRHMPAKPADVLFTGEAVADGDRIRLLTTKPLEGVPEWVRIFDARKVAGIPPKDWKNDPAIHVKFQKKLWLGTVIVLEPHDFNGVVKTDRRLLEANLTDYGFAPGSKIPVQVLTDGDGAFTIGGRSPLRGKHFAGKTVVFTDSITPQQTLSFLCHELCHAFGNDHKCGNWDWIDQTPRSSCCMNYWFHFILDDSSKRAPIPWTQNRVSADLCAKHIRHMRDFHLDENPGLGWK